MQFIPCSFAVWAAELRSPHHIPPEVFSFFFSVANMHRKVSCQGTCLNGRSERTALAWLSLFEAAWWIASLVILSVWGSNKPGDPVGAPEERLHLNQSRGAESMIYDTVAPAAAALLPLPWLAGRSQPIAGKTLTSCRATAATPLSPTGSNLFDWL